MTLLLISNWKWWQSEMAEAIEWTFQWLWWIINWILAVIFCGSLSLFSGQSWNQVKAKTFLWLGNGRLKWVNTPAGMEHLPFFEVWHTDAGISHLQRYPSPNFFCHQPGHEGHLHLGGMSGGGTRSPEGLFLLIFHGACGRSTRVF